MGSRIIRVMTIVMIMTAFTGTYASEKKYDGIVSRSVESNASNLIRPGIDGFTGHLTWIAPVGTFASGPVYNSKGEVIKEGTVLATCDKRFYSFFVDQAEADIKAKKGLLVAAKYDYERKKGLEPTHAIAKSEYDVARGNYYEAHGNLEAAVGHLEYQKLLLENCTMRAAFNCYIVKHINAVGSWTNVDYPTMEVVRLSPMYIDIKMKRDEAKKIFSSENAIKVYPDGSKESFIAYAQYAQITKDGIRIPVSNHFTYIPENIKLPIIEKCSVVARFNIDSNKLAVPVSCIQKDDKGSYVWRAEGQKASGNIAVAREFKVNKEYITLVDELRNILPLETIQCIETPKNLKARDIILEDIPKGLKDGDTVYYHKKDLIFWPGDSVKVIVTE